MAEDAVPPPVATARYIPGQLLAGRYRVVERIGEGGMGEVYRADDLKLGQPVALKFLSESLGDDAQRLQALFAEVRLARQVSHPNVCRVHDIVDVGGAPCLSMEFVDGEDMASLLRRIGRLPQDKAVVIAHELCAGLAAIHDRGLLHGDLKPSNVMLDGRGHARIADFGLAGLQGHGDPELITGTPEYLPPEALSGHSTLTVRGELYSLGLLLYELFTGRAPFRAASLHELIQLRSEGVRVPPSRHQRDLDPAIERALLWCLQSDPRRRPASAREVAAALPGGDPLAAAIALGETPSPAAVAAGTHRFEGLRRATAWSCLGALALGLALVTVSAPRTRLVPRLAPSEPPDALAGRAREVLRAHGLGAGATDRALGYDFDQAAIDRIAATDRSPARWEALGRVRPPIVTFWYRESPGELVPAAPRYRVSYLDPPWRTGMTGVRLDAAGGLVGLDATTAPVPLASPQGTSAAPAGDASAPVQAFVAGTLRPALFLAAMFAGAWLARRNLRARRCDVRRALRVASALLILRVLAWLLGGHHTAGSAMEQTTTTLAWGLCDFAYGWLFYAAIEPYVRKWWPRMLTSWVRFIDGHHADPRVGRDVLIGCMAGTAIALLVAAHQAAPVLFGAPPGRPDNVGYVEHQLGALLGLRQHLAGIVWLLRSSLVQLMGFMVLLVLARLIVRRSAAAVIAAFVMFVPLALPRGELLALNVALAVACTLVVLWVTLRFGLLAGAAALATYALLQSAPLGLPAAAPEANATLLVLAIVALAGGLGFWRAVDRRMVIADDLGAG
jgi:protein kinase-like protein